jgi:hypothetical protein
MPFDILVANSMEFILTACLFFAMALPISGKLGSSVEFIQIRRAKGSSGSVVLLPGASPNESQKFLSYGLSAR